MHYCEVLNVGDLVTHRIKSHLLSDTCHTELNLAYLVTSVKKKKLFIFRSESDNYFEIKMCGYHICSVFSSISKVGHSYLVLLIHFLLNLTGLYLRGRGGAFALPCVIIAPPPNRYRVYNIIYKALPPPPPSFVLPQICSPPWQKFCIQPCLM